MTAVVGKSGHGKTTIVNLLLRLYDVTRGAITLDGADVRDISLESLHSVMGLVSADLQLFTNSIEFNIAYGLEGYTEEDLHKAAVQAGAHDFIMGLKDG